GRGARRGAHPGLRPRDRRRARARLPGGRSLGERGVVGSHRRPRGRKSATWRADANASALHRAGPRKPMYKEAMRLHVNIDHVATLRQARGTSYPDPVWAATLCELAGAQGITCHLREDRRHIQDRDVELLRRTVRTILNLEMAATPAMI